MTNTKQKKLWDTKISYRYSSTPLIQCKVHVSQEVDSSVQHFTASSKLGKAEKVQTQNLGGNAACTGMSRSHGF